MSFTFSVTHQGGTKKVQCPKTNTVNQLITLAIEKFKLPPGTNGELTNGGKKLEGMLQIRLTSLVNNAKLTLETSSGLRELTLKVVGSIMGESVTKIVKISSEATVSLLCGQFAEAAGVAVDLEKRVQLNVLQAVVSNATLDLDEVTVGSLVGSSTSAVIRLLVEEKANQEKREKLQEQQRKLREQLEEHKRQARILERQLNEQNLALQASEAGPQHALPAGDSSTTSEQDALGNEASKESDSGQNESLSSHNNQEDVDMDAEDHTAVALTHASGSTQRPTGVDKKASSETEENFIPAPASAVVIPTEEEDTVYVANNSTRQYENPEEDYNVTMAQAETYFGMLKAMQTKHKLKEAQKPTDYIIRIRFPDRALLDLVVDDSSEKLGQLLKRVDSYVEEKFINTYKLRNGYPPFKEIAMGFTENNTLLHSHPDFQLKKLLLIWEPATKHVSGPYLRPGIHTKDVSELPVVLLESQRGLLEEEAPSKQGRVFEEPKEKKKGKGIPKWFKS